MRRGAPMARKPLPLKQALLQVGAVAAGAFGVAAVLGRMARPRRGARPGRPAGSAPVPRGTKDAAREPLARGAARPAAPPAAEPPPGWQRLDHTLLPEPTY